LNAAGPVLRGVDHVRQLRFPLREKNRMSVEVLVLNKLDGGLHPVFDHQRQMLRGLFPKVPLVSG